MLSLTSPLKSRRDLEPTSATAVAVGQLSAQIKTRDRVKTLAEVFTNEREVEGILGLVQEHASSQEIIKRTYLEPSCGTGNFLVAILSRKLQEVNDKVPPLFGLEYEIATLECLASVYGLDIDASNIAECTERLFQAFRSSYSYHRGEILPSPGYWTPARRVIASNVQVADTLDSDSAIPITEFHFHGHLLQTKQYLLADLVRSKPKAFSVSELAPWAFAVAAV